MPVNNPPVSEDISHNAWQFETNEKVNETEQRLNALLRAIKTATSLSDLQEKVKKI